MRLFRGVGLTRRSRPCGVLFPRFKICDSALTSPATAGREPGVSACVAPAHCMALLSAIPLFIPSLTLNKQAEKPSKRSKTGEPGVAHK